MSGTAMVPRPPPGYVPPPSGHLAVPQTWWEWIWSVYDPDKYIIQPQSHGVTIPVTANTAGNARNIQVPVKFFCFRFSTYAIIAATGAVPTWPYRVGIKNGTGNDWTDGQWMSGLITGDYRHLFQVERSWAAPRELGENEVVTVTVDNNLNAASEALTLDAVIEGYEVRTRNQPIPRAA